MDEVVALKAEVAELKKRLERIEALLGRPEQLGEAEKHHRGPALPHLILKKRQNGF